MATSITLSLRCQSKNLVPGPDGAPFMNVTLQTVNPESGTPPPFSSLTTTLAAADDTFVFGGMYSVTIADEPSK